MKFSGVVMLGLIAGMSALADDKTGEIEVGKAQRGVMSALVRGDAAIEFYDHLAIVPRVEENMWNQDTYIKESRQFRCIKDMVQEGAVVRPDYKCEFKLSTEGAVTR